jgi:hypothetical protein
MDKNKIAPVQGYSAGIPWEMHLRAYDAYKKKYGAQPAMIDLEGHNCRGGFGTGELDMFIPDWREELSLVNKLKEEIVELTEKNQRLYKMVHSRDELLNEFDELVDVLTEGYGAASCINSLTDMRNAIAKIRGLLADKETEVVKLTADCNFLHEKNQHLDKMLHDWDENAEYLLNSYAGSVRIVPGGVQEVLMESLIVTFIKLREEVKKRV